MISHLSPYVIKSYENQGPAYVHLRVIAFAPHLFKNLCWVPFYLEVLRNKQSPQGPKHSAYINMCFHSTYRYKIVHYFGNPADLKSFSELTYIQSGFGLVGHIFFFFLI